jgi:acyl carrier protein
LAYQRLQVLQRFPKELYSYIRFNTPVHEEGEVLVCDISIINSAGQLLMSIQGFTMKRLPQSDVAGSLPIFLARETKQLKQLRTLIQQADAILQLANEYELAVSEAQDAFAHILSGLYTPQVVVSRPHPQQLTQGSSSQKLRLVVDLIEETREPEQLFIRPDIQSEYVSPRNQTERAIADVIKAVIGVDQVGIKDNFFELGGNSLSAVQLVSHLRKTFEVEISLSTIFEEPTVEALAVAIVNKKMLESDAHLTEQILAELEKLSEKDVYDLLNPEA